MHLWSAVLVVVIDVLCGRMVGGRLRSGRQILYGWHHGLLLHWRLHWQENRNRKRNQLRRTVAGLNVGHRMMRRTTATTPQNDDLAALFLGYHTDHQIE